MKVEHEKIHTGGKEPSDEIVNQFILNLNEGSVINSKDQKSGQITHSIINNNYQETEREEERPEDKIKLRCYNAIEEIVHFCIDHFDYNTNRPKNNIPVDKRQNIIHDLVKEFNLVIL